MSHDVTVKKRKLLGYNKKRVKKYLLAMTNNDKELMTKLVEEVIYE
jgi:hypothetical protein